MPVSCEEAADAAKVNARKEVLQVDVEDKFPLLVFCGVTNDGTLALESMCQIILPLGCSLNLVNAILQNSRKIGLEETQVSRRGRDQSLPAASFSDFEGLV